MEKVLLETDLVALVEKHPIIWVNKLARDASTLRQRAAACEAIQASLRLKGNFFEFPSLQTNCLIGSLFAGYRAAQVDKCKPSWETIRHYSAKVYFGRKYNEFRANVEEGDTEEVMWAKLGDTLASSKPNIRARFYLSAFLEPRPQPPANQVPPPPQQEQQQQQQQQVEAPREEPHIDDEEVADEEPFVNTSFVIFKD